MIGQLEFNNLKSYDNFNLIIKTVEVSYPTPKLIKNSVPFQNGEYDFTELYGDTPYSNRPIKVEFEYEGLKVATRTRLYSLYTEIVNWLYGAGESKLIIDYEVGYFKGRVVNISPVEVLSGTGKITVEFDCYPFRIYEQPEGNDIWDIFNFDLDYSQDTSYEVNGELDIDLFNSSIISKTPEVTCSAAMEVTKNGITYKFKPGSSKDWRFILNKGSNKLSIKGTGTIKFKFIKEVL